MQAFLAEPVGRTRAQGPVVTDHSIQLLTLPAHRQPSPMQDNRFAASRVPRGRRVAALQSAHAKSGMLVLHHVAVTRERATRFTRGALGEAVQRAPRFQIVEIRPY